MPTKSAATKSAPSSSKISKDKKAAIEPLVANRPNKQDLIHRNILKSEKVAPGLASAQSQLHKSKVKDSLNSHLTARPQVQDLVNKNVLRTDPKNPRAPAGKVLQAQDQLKKKQLGDKLGKKLQSRTEEDSLLGRNILKAPSAVSPTVANKQQDLQRSQIKDTVKQQAKKHIESQASRGKKRDSKAALEDVPSKSPSSKKGRH